MSPNRSNAKEGHLIGCGKFETNTKTSQERLKRRLRNFPSEKTVKTLIAYIPGSRQDD